MKKVKINLINNSYEKVVVSYDLFSMCFVDNQNNQCMAFTTCRDYMQDAAIACFGKYPEIFRLTKPIYDKQTIIAIKSNVDKFETRVLGMIDFLNQIEKKLRLKRTTVAVIENMAVENTGYVLYGSSRWLSCPQMLSLYTLLIRLGMSHDIGEDYQATITSILEKTKKLILDRDFTYILKCKEGIDYILRNGYVKAFGPIKDRLLKFKINEEARMNGYLIGRWSASHSYSGMMSWCGGTNVSFDKIPTLKSLLEEEKDGK